MTIDRHLDPGSSGAGTPGTRYRVHVKDEWGRRIARVTTAGSPEEAADRTWRLEDTLLRVEELWNPDHPEWPSSWLPCDLDPRRWNEYEETPTWNESRSAPESEEDPYLWVLMEQRETELWKRAQA